MLHNAVHAHKSHVAGLTPLTGKTGTNSRNTLKAPVPAPVQPPACQQQPETSAGFAHRTDLVLFVSQKSV